MIRLALVDDSLLMRTILHRYALRDERLLIVGEAATGREAIELAALEQPDAVILDHEMPAMNGTDAIPHLLQKAPHAIVVMLSSHLDPGERGATIGAGAHAQFSKLDSIPAILDAVVDLVEAARRDVRR